MLNAQNAATANTKKPANWNSCANAPWQCKSNDMAPQYSLAGTVNTGQEPPPVYVKKLDADEISGDAVTCDVNADMTPVTVDPDSV